MSGTMWTLGTVMKEDGPHAEVRENWHNDTSDFRVLIWHRFASGERKRFSGCSRKPCRVGAPCENHEQKAAYWWFEWQRREDLQARREALAASIEVSGVHYTFLPRLPEDNEGTWWGSLRRSRDGKLIGVAVLTRERAVSKWQELTGTNDVPEIMQEEGGSDE